LLACISIGTYLFFFSTLLTTALFPMSDNAINYDYTVHTCICVVLDFLTVTSLAILFKLKCVYALYVSYSKCEENTFTAEETITLSNRKKQCRVDL
jgi:hypothetical protein